MPTDHTSDSRAACRDAFRRAAQVFAPPPDMMVSEWADSYRQLSSEASPAPGQWVTDTAPYQREPMDAVCDPLVQDVVMVWPSQSGKSEMLLNIIGYFIDLDPSPILLMQPSLEAAQDFSKDRIATMVRDTPRLRGKVRDAKTRASGNTILHKTFPGGHITLVGANSPTGLAMRPIRVLLCDEIARYQASAGTEGDPVALAKKRTANFWNRKRVYTSSPHLKGDALDKLWEASDKRLFHVPCPQCGELQVLHFDNLKFDKQHPTPETTYYVCSANGCEIREGDRPEMMRLGRWIAQNPESPTRGYWINRLYAPWTTWDELAQEFIDAKHKGVEALKVFVNTSLAEPWELEGESVRDDELLKRKEVYDPPGCVPEPALLITAGVDVQRDRLEAEKVAWAPNGESWSIEKRIFLGEVDPKKRAELVRRNMPAPDPWHELDLWLSERRRHASGPEMTVACTFIDSGDGVTTAQVYDFCARRWQRRIYACKGINGQGKPIIPARPATLRNGARLWLVGVDTIKEQFYNNLRLEEFGPGYCHFPDQLEYDAEHFKQLTAEKVVDQRPRGASEYAPGRRVWVKTRARNEALDMRVYAIAARESLKVDWKALRHHLEKQVQRLAAKQNEPPAPAPAVEQPVAQPQPAPVRRRPTTRPARSWVTSW
jgi:phage terminase large subunit GpA-like protein